MQEPSPNPVDRLRRIDHLLYYLILALVVGLWYFKDETKALAVYATVSHWIIP